MSGRRGAAQLPSIAGWIPAQHRPAILAGEGLVVVTSLGELALQRGEILPQLDGHVGAGGRVMLGILAQMDLLAVLALKPPRRRPGVGSQLHGPVAEHVDKERRFGVAAAGGYTQVHVMETKHMANLPFGADRR